MTLSLARIEQILTRTKEDTNYYEWNGLSSKNWEICVFYGMTEFPDGLNCQGVWKEQWGVLIDNDELVMTTSNRQKMIDFLMSLELREDEN
jgi:hypothetical protein